MGGFGSTWVSGILPVDAVIAFAPQFSVHPDVVPLEQRWQEFRKDIAVWRHRSLSGSFQPDTPCYTINGSADQLHWSQFPSLPNCQHLLIEDPGREPAAEIKRPDALTPLIVTAMGGGGGGGGGNLLELLQGKPDNAVAALPLALHGADGGSLQAVELMSAVAVFALPAALALASWDGKARRLDCSDRADAGLLDLVAAVRFVAASCGAGGYPDLGTARRNCHRARPVSDGNRHAFLAGRIRMAWRLRRVLAHFGVATLESAPFPSWRRRFANSAGSEHTSAPPNGPPEVTN